MDEDIVSPRPDPPPLRIHHLMACAVVAAVQLSLWRWSVLQINAEMSLANAVFTSLGYGMRSIGLTLALFSIYWQRRGFAAILQPGQWLLIGYILSTVGYCLTLTIRSINRDGLLDQATWGFAAAIVLSLLAFIAEYVLPVLLDVWCAFKVADSLPWRLLFAALAAGTVLASPFGFELIRLTANSNSFRWPMLVAYLLRGIPVAVLGCYTIADDCRTRRARYWTHWCGIGLLLIGNLLTILATISYWASEP